MATVIILNRDVEEKMFSIGRVCIKIAGRDAGKTCVVVKKVDDVFVMIEGETRRRKCNTKHLEILDKKLNINEDASFDEVAKVFKSELGIELKQSKPKKAKERPKKQHIKKEKPVVEKKQTKSSAKKTNTSKTNKSKDAESKKSEDKNKQNKSSKTE